MKGRVNMKDLKGKYVHCETIDQAEELMKETEKQGFKPLNPCRVHFLGENTVYNFNRPNKEVVYASKHFYENAGIKVVEFRYMLEDKE